MRAFELNIAALSERSLVRVTIDLEDALEHDQMGARPLGPPIRAIDIRPVDRPRAKAVKW
jgi:hypothetical protein